MGNTTIIELNHDLWIEIRDNPQDFVNAILAQLWHFEYSSRPDPLTRHIPGGYVVAGFHRSGEPERLWIEFKRALQGVLS